MKAAGLCHRAVASSLEEAGDRVCVFTTPASQWKSARTTNGIEWLHEEFSLNSQVAAAFFSPSPVHKRQRLRQQNSNHIRDAAVLEARIRN